MFVVLIHGVVSDVAREIVEPMIELTMRLVVLIFRAVILFVLIFVVLIHGAVKESVAVAVEIYTLAVLSEATRAVPTTSNI
jgi:hypothetical protein